MGDAKCDRYGLSMMGLLGVSFCTKGGARQTGELVNRLRTERDALAAKVKELEGTVAAYEEGESDAVYAAESALKVEQAAHAATRAKLSKAMASFTEAVMDAGAAEAREARLMLGIEEAIRHLNPQVREPVRALAALQRAALATKPEAAEAPKRWVVCATCKAMALVGSTGVHSVGCDDSFPVKP